MLLENEGHFCLPVIEYPTRCRGRSRWIQRSVITKREPRFELSRTQDLEACYHDAGSFYWGLSGLWMSDHGLHSRSVGLPVSRS